MNNKAIPTLLIATIMIAGAFAFMPVQEASTVHTGATTILGTNGLSVLAVADDSIDAGAIATDAIGSDELAATAVVEIQTTLTEITTQLFTDADLTEATDIYTMTCTGDSIVLFARAQQLPAADGTTTDLTVAFGTTSSGAAGILAAADADAAISLAVVTNVPLLAGEVMTMTTGGTADADDTASSFKIIASTLHNSATTCTITETA